MNERRLTLYTRRNCSLCDEMAARLDACLAGQTIPVDIVDVDTDADLKVRFGWDVPLLFDGNIEICRHEFAAKMFLAWLHGQTKHT